jgi:NADH dehydrogenase/putative oxidoreductase
MTEAASAPSHIGQFWTGIARTLLSFRRIASLTAWPGFDLVLRLLLAQPFLASGLIKLSNMNQAMFLAANEYPVSWAPPAIATILGLAVELGAGLLMAAGLFTRLASLALAAMAMVIQTAYQPLDLNLHWAVLGVWFALHGAGPISLDALIRRGLADSALPLAPQLSRLFDWLKTWAAPTWMVFIRYWIAAIFFASGLTKIADWQSTLFLFEHEYQTPFLPIWFAAGSATVLELAMPVLLIAGLFTRLATLPLIAMTAVIQFTYLDHIDHLYWVLLLGLILTWGPGRFSLDALGERWLRARLPLLFDRDIWRNEALPHVIVVGAGFGGVAAARALKNAPCRVTVIDRHNYHLFQPLLYQVATAGLSPADIAAPIRELFRDQPNARVLMGRVTDIQRDDHCVVLEDGRALAFDHLVIATGARHSYFGNEAWEPYAPGLKKIEDATDVRRRILLAFERAENEEDPERRTALTTFAVVGGGPTGVEIAGAIAELARHGMGGEFRNISPEDARVILVQSGDRLLPAFPETLSAATQRELEDIGVEVMTGARVTDIDAEGLSIGDNRIEAGTVVWGAGIIASAAGRWLSAERDRAGRVVVGPDLTIEDADNIFVVGDTAASDAWNGNPVPGLAPAAKQGGQYAASVIAAKLSGKMAPGPFKYKHAGSLATIGRSAAVADFGWIKLSGAPAWWLWSVAHVLFLTSARNRLAVAVEWIWAYLTFRRSTRLITGK